jgi:hypothetical protein
MKSTLPILLIILTLSCRKKDDSFSKKYEYNFNQQTHGWSGLFSDYPVGQEANYELSIEHVPLPAPLDNAQHALKISGINHSDDLLSILYKKIDGLLPNTTYQVSFEIEFASNACISCAGVGGSPNLSMGAGGLKFAPANSIADGLVPYYRPNFTVKIQSGESNEVMRVLGKIGTGEGLNLPYKLKTLDNLESPVAIATNANGELWVMAGVDSGFEGETALYYKRITVFLAR